MGDSEQNKKIPRGLIFIGARNVCLDWKIQKIIIVSSCILLLNKLSIYTRRVLNELVIQSSLIAASLAAERFEFLMRFSGFVAVHRL